MSELIFRKGTLRDAAQIKELDSLLIQSQKKFSWYYDLKENYLKKVEEFTKKCLKSKNHFFILAQLNKEIIGYALIEIKNSNSITTWGKEAILFDLIVKSNYRRKKIGSMLFDKVEEFVKSKGIKILKLSVLFSNNPARELYKIKKMTSFKEELIKKL